MVEDQFGLRRDESHGPAPWTKLFMAFKVARDPKKLLLASAGIVIMAAGWWLLAFAFYYFNSTPPTWQYYRDHAYYNNDRAAAWNDFKSAWNKWALLHSLAGPPPVKDENNKIEAKNFFAAADFAESADEYEAIKRKLTSYKSTEALQKQLAGAADEKQTKILKTALTIHALQNAGRCRSYGFLATLPWFEERGDSPLLIVTDLTSARTPDEKRWPWDEGKFFDWLLTEQAPVLLEPLFKFFSPVRYLFHPHADIIVRAYLILVILWTVATWSFFGGAITRMAVVDVARPADGIGLREALRFACKRYISYLSAQLIPLGFLALLLLLLVFFGFLEMVIPGGGDIVIAGIGFSLFLLIAFVVTVLLIGLVGWPMMHATISAEGSDAFDAISRSYSYVFQAAWNYAGYSVVGILYGAVLIFLVGLMGTLTVYVGKAGMSWGGSLNLMDREPTYLFTYAPTSYGWRNILLEGGRNVKSTEIITNSGTLQRTLTLDPVYESKLYPQNRIGAYMVAFWIWLLLLLIIAFGYSYFWSQASIIYLLMRQKVDDTEIDEVHMEEEIDAPYMPAPSSPPAEQRGGTMPLQMVDSPGMAPAPPESPNNAETDESPPNTDTGSQADGAGDAPPEETDQNGEIKA